MKTFASSLLFLAIVLAGPALATGEGTAVGVDPDAAARLGSTDRVLEVGADVSVGELIVTGPRGQVQIVFDDETRLVVGPGSSLRIETYLLASNNTAQKLAIDALGGSFRFITGNSPKPAYSITTPTAAIAVRGTEFDLLVQRDLTGVLLYEGALALCAPGSECIELTDRCEVGTASTREATLFALPDPERQPLSLQFRYAQFQSGLLAPFRIAGAVKCTERAVQGGTPDALGTTGTGIGVTPPPQVRVPVVRAP